MDQREISRLNMKFAKFLDPLIILTVVAIICTSVIAVFNLSPRAFSQKEALEILGVDTEPKLELIHGGHKYITNENLQKISNNHFKYSTFIQERRSGKISKPIVKIQGTQDLKIQIVYTNSKTSKISLVSESDKTSYLIQENTYSYSPNININSQTEEMYLLVENTKPVFFKQYIEINFFLNP